MHVLLLCCTLSVVLHGFGQCTVLAICATLSISESRFLGLESEFGVLNFLTLMSESHKK